MGRENMNGGIDTYAVPPPKTYLTYLFSFQQFMYLLNICSFKFKTWSNTWSRLFEKQHAHFTGAAILKSMRISFKDAVCLEGGLVCPAKARFIWKMHKMLSRKQSSYSVCLLPKGNVSFPTLSWRLPCSFQTSNMCFIPGCLQRSAIFQEATLS